MRQTSTTVAFITVCRLWD